MTSGQWEIDAYMPQAECWHWLTMTHCHGATAAIRILHEHRHVYGWVWREHWLGMTTTLLSPRAFTSRRRCIAHLVMVMRELGIELIPTVLEQLL